MDIKQNYNEIRHKHPNVPACVAYRCAKQKQKIENWTRTTGFKWREDHYGDSAAHWSQEGFELSAKIEVDDDGWWLHGEDDYGRFISSWEPGAIHHWPRERRACKWFLPANPETGRQDYKRACRFGTDWWYVGIVVTARRTGIKLGEASLWGIESDSEEDYFTETVIDLAGEVIAEAKQALRRLCVS